MQRTYLIFFFFSFIAEIAFNMSALKLRTQQSLPEAEHIPVRKVQELLFQMCLPIKMFLAMTKSHHYTHPEVVNDD